MCFLKLTGVSNSSCVYSYWFCWFYNVFDIPWKSPTTSQVTALRLVISHYEIVSSQLRSNHCDIHWAFCLSDWDAALLKSEAQWIIAHVVVGGCCNTLSITTTNSCTHSSWWPPSYDQRLYSRCLEQWFEYQGASRTPPSQRCEAHQWYCDGGGRRAF